MCALPPFLLFDLDDTILNFDGVSDLCWQQLCETVAPQLGGVTAGGLMSAIQSARAWFWSDPARHRRGRLDLLTARRELVAWAFDRLGVCEPALSQAMADAYTEQREELVYPFAGAIESLRRFQDQGIRMGLVTNVMAASQRKKIERFRLAEFFQIILIEGEFGVGKPDHRVFQFALEALQAPCHQAGMVGNDLEYDIRPALELGMQAIWVDCAKSGLPADSAIIPTRTIHSLAEL